jgi:hypothetical protein
VSDGDDSCPVRFGELGHSLTIVRESRLERLELFPFGMLGRKLVQPGAILIESGNAILGLDVVGTRLVSHFIDERNERLLRRPVIPGRKRRSLSIGVGVDSQRHCEKHEGGESARQLRDLSDESS